jgi:uncharacterized membrane protein YsdA (DUF1294 family)
MSKKRKGSKGSYRMDPKLEWSVYPLIISILLTLPIWAFSPFNQNLHVSWVIGISITLFGLYGYDKGQAKSNGKRIPEINLHGISLIGGFIGGLVGMYFFRHKTKKKAFLTVILASAALHVIIFFLI